MDAPRCAEAYDIALLMYRVTSDDALTWALLAAGADKEDIPQIMSTRAGIGRLNTMLAEIADAAHDGDNGIPTVTGEIRRVSSVCFQVSEPSSLSGQ